MKQRRPSLIGPIIAFVLIGGGLVWWVTALTNGDLLWFLHSFTPRADWIVIYWDGETTMLFPGDPHYNEVMDAFADAVAHWSGYENGVGLSDENLARYRNEWRLLELYYNDPVTVHTRHLFPEARTFFVPLSGTHANWRRIFSGLIDKPRIGVLNASAERFEQLATVIEQAVQ